MPSISEARILLRYFTNTGKSWVPTAAAWGTVGGATLLFLTDWKVVLGNVPFIKGKFEHETPR